jgi:hypothetical protein
MRQVALLDDSGCELKCGEEVVSLQVGIVGEEVKTRSWSCQRGAAARRSSV